MPPGGYRPGTGPGPIIVGPGSRTTGKYRLVGPHRPAPVDCPEAVELLDGLRGMVVSQPHQRDGSVRVIRAGGRSNGLASMAGSMVRAGFSHKTIDKAILRHNRKHCDPPLGEAEVRATVPRSVRRWRR